MADVYEEARINALKELERHNRSTTIEAALSFNLHNSSQLRALAERLQCVRR
jgi:hypothetical protein